jgi:hypothetical protein
MIYARSDIQSVSISEAHGGCGQAHQRPEGERVWALSCERCEGHLRTDPLWTANLDELPLTPDEQKADANREKNLARRQMHATESAAGLLAMLAGPHDLLAGKTAVPVPESAECHKCAGSVPVTARFCGHCGAPNLREAKAIA